jgi:hypothetical protein
MKKLVLLLLVTALVGISQAALTGEYLFNGSAVDTSPTGATLTVVGATVNPTTGVTFSGSAGAYVKAVAPSSAWDGKYWSNASEFTMTWDLDFNTSTAPTGTNGGALLMFTDTSKAGGISHVRGNKILAMDNVGKIWVAANSIQNNSSNLGTNSYKSVNTYKDGVSHHVQVQWDIKAGGVSTPLQNDTVKIVIDNGLETVIVPNFDWNYQLLMNEMNGNDDPAGNWYAWTAPGMVIGYNLASNANAWKPFTGTIDNVQINLVPEPATLSMLGLGALALLRKKRA